MSNIDWESVVGWIFGLGFWALILGFPIVSGLMSSDDDTSAAATSDTASESTPSDSSYTPDYSDYPEPEPEPEPEYYYNSTPSYVSNSSCNSNYSGCVDDSYYDLDCADIGEEVEVIGYDEYGLDRDGDGYGCESY